MNRPDPALAPAADRNLCQSPRLEDPSGVGGRWGSKGDWDAGSPPPQRSPEDVAGRQDRGNSDAIQTHGRSNSRCTPRWGYLTGAYVEAAALPVAPVRFGRDASVRLGGGALPTARPSPFREAVFLDGYVYLRDGTGYTLHGPGQWR